MAGVSSLLVGTSSRTKGYPVTLHPSMMQMFPEDSPRRVLETGMAGPCRASRNQGVMCLVGGEHAKESRLPEGWSWGMAMGELSDFQERHRGEP